MKHLKEMILPDLGQGIGAYVWTDKHIEIIRAGVEIGINLIDTAEEYDNGNAEVIIGKSTNDIRDNVIIATKFSPQNNGYGHVIKSCEQSLLRLQTDYIDIYQMHWPNPDIPILETMQAMEYLLSKQMIRYIGLGNMSFNDLVKLSSDFPIDFIQIEYNLFDRYIEKNILSFCDKNNIAVLAYSPLDHGNLSKCKNNILENLSLKYHKSVSQIALKWLIDKRVVIPIPKTGSINHLMENADYIFYMEDTDVVELDKMGCDREAIPPKDIKVSISGEGGKYGYQTLEEAKNNHLKFVPSPISLSKSIEVDNNVKPIRLIKKDSYYELIEGRIRYWAWVIAFGYDVPIPSYIRRGSNWIK